MKGSGCGVREFFEMFCRQILRAPSESLEVRYISSKVQEVGMGLNLTPMATLQAHGSEMHWFWISNSDLCLLQSHAKSALWAQLGRMDPHGSAWCFHIDWSDLRHRHLHYLALSVPKSMWADQRTLKDEHASDNGVNMH